MHDSREDFTFEDGDRTFTCHTAPLRPGQPETWWWYEVSTDRNKRHAPFRTESGDTRDSVQARVIAFHDYVEERRAAPPRKWWSRRSAEAQAADAPPTLASVMAAASDQVQ